MPHRTTPRAVLLLGGCLLALVGPGHGQEPEPAFLKRPASQWVRELADKEPAVRRSAAFALGKLGLPVAWAVPDLLKALADSRPSVREAAAFALGEIGPTDDSGQAVAALLKALKDDNDKVRRSAAFALGRYGARGSTIAVLNPANAPEAGAVVRKNAAAAVAALREALADPQAIVRQSAAFALGELALPPDDANVQALASLLGTDDDPGVRRDAAIALGRMKQAARKALPALLARFRSDEDGVVRRAALDALVEMVNKEDRAVAPDLVKAMKGKDPDVARNAAFGLATIGGDTAAEAVPVLRKLIGLDEEPAVRRQAFTALGNIGEQAPEALRDFERGLKEEDPQIRRACALGLGRLGEKARPAVPALLKVLSPEEKTEAVRQYAAEALAGIAPDDPNVVKAAIKVLAEANNYLVRHRTIWILERTREFDKAGPAEALTQLLRERGKDAKLLRYEAAKVLAMRLGDKAPDKAVSVLQDALGDKVYRYAGTFARVGASSEGDAGTADVKAVGAGDWRQVVAIVLKVVGKDKAGTPEILEALKNVERTSWDPEAAKAAKDAYEYLGGK